MITGASGTLVFSLSSPITLLSLPGLLGLFGLMISAVTLLSLPGFRSTGISILPLSISSWLIGFSVFLPLSSVTTTLSPGFTEPSFGIVTSTVVLPASLSPALFSSSEILPSLFVSSGNLISGLLGFLVVSGSIVVPAPAVSSSLPPRPLSKPPLLPSTGPAKDAAPKGLIALVLAFMFE